jgi:UDP-glucose 4-epimerase
VLDIVKAYEAATGITIPYKIVDRRPGDIDECCADPTKAFNILGWKARFGIEDMCRDSNNWQLKNPNGYNE